MWRVSSLDCLLPKSVCSSGIIYKCTFGLSCVMRLWVFEFVHWQDGCHIAYIRQIQTDTEIQWWKHHVAIKTAAQSSYILFFSLKMWIWQVKCCGSRAGKLVEPCCCKSNSSVHILSFFLNSFFIKVIIFISYPAALYIAPCFVSAQPFHYWLQWRWVSKITFI